MSLFSGSFHGFSFFPCFWTFLQPLWIIDLEIEGDLESFGVPEHPIRVDDIPINGYQDESTVLNGALTGASSMNSISHRIEHSSQAAIEEQESDDDPYVFFLTVCLLFFFFFGRLYILLFVWLTFLERLKNFLQVPQERNRAVRLLTFRFCPCLSVR